MIPRRSAARFARRYTRLTFRKVCGYVNLELERANSALKQVHPDTGISQGDGYPELICQ
jgi:hypothetical protein